MKQLIFKHNQPRFKQVILQLKMIHSGQLFFSSQSHSHKLELTFLTRAVRSWTKSLRRLCRVCSSRDWKRRLLKCHWNEGTRWIHDTAGTRPSTRDISINVCKPTIEAMGLPASSDLPTTHILPLHLASSQGHPKVQRLGTQTMKCKLEQSLLACCVSNRTFFSLQPQKFKSFLIKIPGGLCCTRMDSFFSSNLLCTCYTKCQQI